MCSSDLPALDEKSTAVGVAVTVNRTADAPAQQQDKPGDAAPEDAPKQQQQEAVPEVSCGTKHRHCLDAEFTHEECEDKYKICLKEMENKASIEVKAEQAAEAQQAAEEALHPEKVAAVPMSLASVPTSSALWRAAAVLGRRVTALITESDSITNSAKYKERVNKRSEEHTSELQSP